jgi:IS4 transposase
MHTLLDLRGNISAFIHVSDGKMADVNAFDLLTLEAGAFYAMDRGYLDYERLYTMHQAGAFFVTRARRRMDARRVYSRAPDKTHGIICDQTIAFEARQAQQDYPEHLRRIRFYDAELGKTLIFLTNNTALPSLTVAALYKSRWQVELFFKWIKQHLRIKQFLGTSENAVKTQIWCAVATYVLIAIVREELKLPYSLYTLLQVLSTSVFEKTPILQAFARDTNNQENIENANQLNLLCF